MGSGAQSSVLTGRKGLLNALEAKGTATISFEDWLKIDGKEKEMGMMKGKIREKIVDYDDMLKIAGKSCLAGRDMNMVV